MGKGIVFPQQLWIVPHLLVHTIGYISLAWHTMGPAGADLGFDAGGASMIR